MWLQALQVSQVGYLENFLMSIWLLVNSEYGSTLFAVALILLLISLKLSRRRLKGLLDLLGSTDGSDSGTLEGNSLASNIGYLLNKYTLTWENHGAVLSQDLEVLKRAVDQLSARLYELSEVDHDVEERELLNHLNAPLLDDPEKDTEVGDDE